MCLNILYYDLSKETKLATPVDLPFGVLYIAPQQVRHTRSFAFAEMTRRSSSE